MNPKKVALLTALWSVSVGVGAVYPSVAGTVSQLGQGETLISQTMMGDPYRATVKMIRNNIVTLDLPDGETRQIELPRTEQEKLALLPGTEILVYPDGMVALYQPMLEPEATTSSTIDEIREVFERINSRQRTTTVTTPAPTPVRTMPTTTQPAMQPAPVPVRVETAPQQPVRALW